jgi:hypothetical protein
MEGMPGIEAERETRQDQGRVKPYLRQEPAVPIHPEPRWRRPLCLDPKRFMHSCLQSKQHHVQPFD